MKSHFSQFSHLLFIFLSAILENMLRDFLTHSLASIIVLWLSDRLLVGASFTGSTTILIFCGIVLGFLNAFVKPIFATLTLPLRILTLGLFSFALNMITLELVDILFPELIIQGIVPLLKMTLGLGTVIRILQEKA